MGNDKYDRLSTRIPLAARHWIGMHGFDPDKLSDGQIMNMGELMAMDADAIRLADWDALPSTRNEQIIAMYRDALESGDMDTVNLIENIVKEIS